MHVYHLYVFGFFSELRNLANALAWFGPCILDTQKWIGNYKNGLFDYLECRELFIEKDKVSEENIVHIGRQTPEQFQHLVNARCMCEISQNKMDFFMKKMEVCRRLWKICKPAMILELFILEVIGLPNDFISVHIRKGDNDDYNKISLSEYSEEIKKHECSNIFLMTDDERIIPELKELCPTKNIYFYQKNMTGWDEGTFYTVKPFDKYMHLLHLIAEVDICRRSLWHIGSGSNVSHFLRFIHNNFNNFTILKGDSDIV